MNFLKKKLKVHKKGHINDDDLDDYIPPVPPHPSEIAAYQEQQRDLLTCETLSSNGKPPDLAKVIAEKSINKEKEEWKFLEQLNQRVAAAVNSTSSALEKIKDTSAAEEIANKPEFDEEDEFDNHNFLQQGVCGVVAKDSENWIAFDQDKHRTQKVEGKKVKPERPPLPGTKSETKKSDQKCDQKCEQTCDQKCDQTVPPSSSTISPSANKTHSANLLDDFGFGYEPQPNGTELSAVNFDYENDYLDDPFDTSFVDISVVEPHAAASSIIEKSALTKRPSNCDTSQDPFDTVFVENAIRNDSSISCSTQPANCENIDLSDSKQVTQSSDHLDNCDRDLVESVYTNKLERSSRYSSRDSIASIMSNPFLVDTDYYTPTIRSGTTTPFSGTVTPRRRNSTNPFEQSPEEEYPVINTEASAIAALTEDFCKAIGDISRDNNVNASPVNQHVSSNFDPFGTVYDEYIDNPLSTLNANDNNTELMSNEILETSNKPEPNDNLLTASDAHLDYFSDLSDNEDFSKTDKDNEEDKKRQSSAFQMELLDRDKKEPPPRFDPLPILIRKLSLPVGYNQEDSYEPSLESAQENSQPRKAFFDPFDTVVDRDSPTTPPSCSYDQYYEHTTYNTDKPVDFEDHKLYSDSSKVKRQDSQESLDKQDTFRRTSTDSKMSRHDSQGSQTLAYEGNSSSKVRDRFLSNKFFSVKDKEVVASCKDDESNHVTSSPGSPVTYDTIDQPNKNENVHDVSTGSDSGLVESNKDFDTGAIDYGKDSFDNSDVNTKLTKETIPFTDTSAFDAFEAKFDQAQDQKSQALSSSFDPFASNIPLKVTQEEEQGFDSFDPFSPSLGLSKDTSSAQAELDLKKEKKDSFDDDDDKDNFKVVIKARLRENRESRADGSVQVPLLAPPPKTVVKAFADREQPSESKEPVEEFDEFEAIFGKDMNKVTTSQPPSRPTEDEWPLPGLTEATTKRYDSPESPQTPLFDEDDTSPLEDFSPKYEGDGWEMYVRHPAKKKLTGNRFWKKVFIRLSENSSIQLFNKKTDNEPFQELPLQACYSLSEISSQQYDQYGKIFTIKLQYIFYRERVSVRSKQIAKVVQGQIPSMSSIAKLGIPLEHVPQISQLLKLGSQSYSDIKVFAQLVEDCFFKMVIHRDRALTYKTEEIQCTVQDEYYVEQTKTGLITKQLARVRIFLLAFVNGMPSIEIGVNDITRQGKEIVGRHDIIPVVTEEWIRLEACEFHCAVIKEEFEKESRLIKLHPPDACFVEVMRFRVRPPKNRELPLQVSTNLFVSKTEVKLRCEVLVPGCISRKHGQIPCEDISIRIHIPECWIYFFRTEKHLRYGSVKSMSRRPGKIKVRIIYFAF